MIEINGKIDQNDYEFFRTRYGEPVAALPAPFVNGQPKFNFTRFLMKDGQLGFVAHVKPIYYEHHNGQMRPLEEILEHHGNDFMVLKPDWDTKASPSFMSWLIRRQQLIQGGQLLIPSPYHSEPIRLTEGRLLFSSFGPYYPDNGSTTRDGYCGSNPVSTTWALLRASNGNESGALASLLCFYLAGTGALWNEMIRTVFPIDTSGIGSGNTVTAATFSAFGNVGSTDNFSQSVVLTTSSQASNTAIANSDFQLNVGNPLQSDSGITVTAWSETAYNDLTLNATGRGNVSLTGITHLGLQGSGDQSNTEPVDISAAAAAKCSSSSVAGTTQDPKIAGTYSPISVGGVISTLTMLGAG